ncbi:MAG TPA: sterol desaturase family protein [Thauera sp.]|nr:sterol desaturase family protein [Thauera sp.]
MAEAGLIRVALPYPASLAVPALGLCALGLMWPSAIGPSAIGPNAIGPNAIEPAAAVPDTMGPWLAAAAVLAGLAAWTLLEYVLHRVLMHHVEPFRTWHLAHHRNPAEPIRVPLVFSLVLVVAVIGLPLAALTLLGVDGGLALVFSAGLLLGDVLQQTVHQRLHPQPVSGPGLARLHLARLRVHHGYHHFVDEERAFGTLTAFWDRCLGTAPPRRR